MDRPHCSPGVMSDCQRDQALRWTGGPPMDIQFAVCLCVRYQASPRTSHRQAVHRRAYTTVAEPPLRVPSSHGRPTPSIVSGPLEGFCLSPSRSSSSTSSPSKGLQSIGGLELVDNHSSHQESNKAGPLAFSEEEGNGRCDELKLERPWRSGARWHCAPAGRASVEGAGAGE